MSEVPPTLAAFATAELRKRGIEVRTSTTIEAVTERTVTLSGGEVVPARTLVWTAGVEPHPVVAELGLPLGEGGRIVADRFCAVRAVTGVWAIGDAAGVPDPAKKDGPSPPTAQHVLRQAKVVADNVMAALTGDGPSGGRSATGRSACSSTWAATRRSPRHSGSAGAASRRGSSPAPTTWR